MKIDLQELYIHIEKEIGGKKMKAVDFLKRIEGTEETIDICRIGNTIHKHYILNAEGKGTMIDHTTGANVDIPFASGLKGNFQLYTGEAEVATGYVMVQETKTGKNISVKALKKGLNRVANYLSDDERIGSLVSVHDKNPVYGLVSMAITFKSFGDIDHPFRVYIYTIPAFAVMNSARKRDGLACLPFEKDIDDKYGYAVSIVMDASNVETAEKAEYEHVIAEISNIIGAHVRKEGIQASYHIVKQKYPISF